MIQIGFNFHENNKTEQISVPLSDRSENKVNVIQKVQKKYSLLRENPHMREVMRGTLLAFGIKIIGSGLSFAFNVLVARLLGAEGAGVYFLALAITTIASVIGRVGLDNALLRFVATGAAQDDWSRVNGMQSLGMRIAIAVSGGITLLTYFAAPWLAEWVFKKSDLADPLRWMSFSILPFALLNLQAESLKGLKCIRDAMLVQGVGIPLLSISILLVMLLTQYAGARSLQGVSIAYLVATIFVAMLGAWFWKKALAGRGKATEYRIYFRVLWSSCRPLFLVSVLNRAVLPWASLFLLGIWVESDEVGVFGAALRVAMLVSFMLVTINNVIAPKFAELYAQNNFKALGETARHSALLITILISPIFIALILAGNWIMAIYGSEFERGGAMLAVLSVGQLVNVMTGSVGYLLIMSGNETTMRNLTLLSTGVMLLLSVLLIPSFAGLGAAIATAAGVAMNNLCAVWMVKKKLGILTLPFLKNSL